MICIYNTIQTNEIESARMRGNTETWNLIRMQHFVFLFESTTSLKSNKTFKNSRIQKSGKIFKSIEIDNGKSEHYNSV